MCVRSNLDGLGKVTSYSNCRTGLHPVRREIGMTIKPSHLLNSLFKPTLLNHPINNSLGSQISVKGVEVEL